MDYVLPFLIAFGVALIGTILVIRVARAFGWVAAPRADRWHKKPTALYGGIAIYLGFTISFLSFYPLNRGVIGLLGGATFIFLLGLLDDALAIKPSTKLIGQIAAACILLLTGTHATSVIHPAVAIPMTVLWVVGITNAFNLLDNMDGLSSGVSVISSGFLFLFSMETGNAEIAALAACIAGAALGFLVFNFNPAKIFMGDCGSMLLGFVLSGLSIMGTWHEASNLFLVLAIPVLILAVPIFDTTLVTVIRKLSGRAVSQGGRDHSSHRLVALGLSERSAVVVLWSLCLAFGGIALAGLYVNRVAVAVATAMLIIGIFFFGVFLGEVQVYRRAPLTEKSANEGSTIINTILLHKRRMVEVLIDFVLICVAYVSAYLLRYEGVIDAQNLEIIYRSLPLMIVVKMATFFYFGLYRGLWRYVGLTDAMNIVKAVAVGSGASAFLLILAYRLEGHSRAVLVVDALLLVFLLVGVRALLRVFRETFIPYSAEARRILVVGAGDAGAMLVREMSSNPALGLRPVGFVDIDVEKHGRLVHGVPVLGSQESLPEIAQRVGVDEVLIALPRASGEAIQEVTELCRRSKLPYRTSPRLAELVDGKVSLTQFRELEVADLLGRPSLAADATAIRKSITGKTVLITGAGGTVGAEVARRALLFGARAVVLADLDDNALSGLVEELRASGFENVHARLVDLGGPGEVNALFEEFPAEIVIHTAGVNQVSLLEGTVVGAVRGNVVTTQNVARAARHFGAEALVMMSTTKAFAPGNVAASSRRAGEVVALSSASEDLKVRVVRIPNVLGSRGGVLRRFEQQLANGRVLRITHPDAARRFVTVAEAAGLLLESLALETGANEVLVPHSMSLIPVMAIARSLVQVARLDLERDVVLSIVGLRPGETLIDAEPDAKQCRDLGHARLRALRVDVGFLVDAEQLNMLVKEGDSESLRRLLAHYVVTSSPESRGVERQIVGKGVV